ncbi:MAG: UPF0280 family protein [Coriobacteriia bacterium]|nr:UPF0280 family protein [Coriobacteriia bacterium]
MVWEPREYRQQTAAEGLVTFEVVQDETDLQVSAQRDLALEAAGLVASVRADLQGYIGSHPFFEESFVPVDVEPDSPEIVLAMAAAGRAAGVGPMAAVAGAIAERVARGLAALSAEVIVENGGDLYVVGATARRILLLAGDSPLSGRVAIALGPESLPIAVCTSSGKVGHSVSLGIAHGVTVLATDGAVADATATAAGNMVHGVEDVEKALEFALGVSGVSGAVVIAEDRIGALGDVTLVPVEA